jgi:GNAT acetyltransferase-like protein
VPRARADVVFERADERLGRFALRPVSPDGDAALLHGWLTHPKSAFWQMRDADVAGVAATYHRIAGSEHHQALLGLHDGEPAFLVELYDPAHDELGRAYPVAPGDAGMHFLVSPTDRPLHGFTRAVLDTVLDFLFADPSVRRVVVEPDVRNHAVRRLNVAAGFVEAATVRLSTKDACVSFRTRDAR